MARTILSPIAVLSRRRRRCQRQRPRQVAPAGHLLAACLLSSFLLGADARRLRLGYSANQLVLQKGSLSLGNTYYASEVCVEAAGSYNVKFRVTDETSGDTVVSWTDYYGATSTETKCKTISGPSYGDSLTMEVKIEDGDSSTYSMTYASDADTVTYYCEGTLSKSSCSCNKNCYETAPTCTSPTLSDVTVTNAIFTEDTGAEQTYECNNTDGTSSETCSDTFTWTATTSSTITTSTSVTISAGETISLGASIDVVDASDSVSYTVSASYTNTDTESTTTTYTSTSTCSTTVDAGSCSEIAAEFLYGTLTADYSGTITCSDGASYSATGTMSFDNVYSTTMTDSCTASDC